MRNSKYIKLIETLTGINNRWHSLSLVINTNCMKTSLWESSLVWVQGKLWWQSPKFLALFFLLSSPAWLVAPLPKFSPSLHKWAYLQAIWLQDPNFLMINNHFSSPLSPVLGFHHFFLEDDILFKFLWTWRVVRFLMMANSYIVSNYSLILNSILVTGSLYCGLYVGLLCHSQSDWVS